jgi:hypothetical protein
VPLTLAIFLMLATVPQQDEKLSPVGNEPGPLVLILGQSEVIRRFQPRPKEREATAWPGGRSMPTSPTAQRSRSAWDWRLTTAVPASSWRWTGHKGKPRSQKGSIFR